MEYDLRKRGASPIDTYMDRCLRYAEQINDLTQVPDRQKVPARRRIFKVYFNLQDYNGIEHTQEEHLEDMMGDLDLAIVEAHSADVRSGGMGYSSVSNVMMAGGLGLPKNPYWNAGNAAKAKKIVFFIISLGIGGTFADDFSGFIFPTSVLSSFCISQSFFKIIYK